MAPKRARSRSRTPGPSAPPNGGLATPSAGSKRARATTPGTPSKRIALIKGLNPLPAPLAPPKLPISAVGAPTKLKRELFLWGNGDMGQFGLGTEVLSDIKRPRLHTWVQEKNQAGELGEYGLEMVVAGGMHTLAIDSNGYVYSWGINDNAALGRRTDRGDKDNTEELETQPLPIEGLSPIGRGVVGGPSVEGGEEGEVERFRATRVAASSGCGIALNEKGQLRIWGSFRSNEGLLGFEPTPGADQRQFLPGTIKSLDKIRFSAVTCGEDHILALTLDGLVYTWGNGQQGQLGRRIIERRKINALAPSKLDLKNIVSIGAGAFHSFAVDNQGNVYGWGLNTFGQLGVEPIDDLMSAPVVIPELSPEKHAGSKVIQIEAGEHFSLFLFDNGEVWGSGRCDAHQLGIDEKHSAMQAILKQRQEWSEQRDIELAKELEAYEKRMAAKKSEAQANGVAAGAFDGVLSAEDMRPVKGPPPTECVFEPVHIPFPDNVRIVDISCGARFSVAVAADGSAYTWGLGVNSELGQGDEEDIETPTLLRSKTLNTHAALSASAGGQHSVLLAVPKPTA